MVQTRSVELKFLGGLNEDLQCNPRVTL